MSVQARDRKLETWYKRVKDGEIKLPRFQRFEAWVRISRFPIAGDKDWDIDGRFNKFQLTLAVN